MRARVEPPAPYVIETKDGRSGCSAEIVAKRRREPSSSRGGKNSNEKNGRRLSSASSILTARTYRKLAATPPQSIAQPSTMTKSSSFTGSETTGGLSIIMPSPINIAATARSMATNGR